MENKNLNPKSRNKIFGIPVNWDFKNWHKGIWNVDDDKIIQPKRVGIGWTINFHALLKRTKILK